MEKCSYSRYLALYIGELAGGFDGGNSGEDNVQDDSKILASATGLQGDIS